MLLATSVGNYSPYKLRHSFGMLGCVQQPLGSIIGDQKMPQGVQHGDFFVEIWLVLAIIHKPL